MPRCPPITALLLATSMSVTAAEQTQSVDSPWKWTLDAGAVYQSSASLDSGGDMSAGRAFVSGGLGRVFARRWRVGTVSDLIRKSDVSTAPFFGATLKVKF
jgi:hypothetical protein